MGILETQQACRLKVGLYIFVYETQTAASVRIIASFTQTGVNIGVQIVPENLDLVVAYPTNPPWDDIADEYPQVQCGSFTIFDRDYPDPASLGWPITFPQAFRRPPTLTCWLTGFETTEFPIRARVRTSEISETGFILHLDPTTLASAGICWLAGLPRNQIGGFDSHASGSWADTPPLLFKGFKVTGQRAYARAAVAITQVDIGGTPAFPLKLEPYLPLGCDHFTWTMTAGNADKGLYLLKGAYMLF